MQSPSEKLRLLEVKGYEMIAELFKIALILPSGSVDVERTFSTLKHQVGANRGSLSSSSIESILLISD